MKRNGLLVEYKKPSALKTSKQQKEAQEQLINYFDQLKDTHDITKLNNDLQTIINYHLSK